jgi:hypothetical protein
MTGIEAMQLRAVADAVIGVHPEAVVSMTLDDVGVMHVQVDHPGGDPPTRRLTVDTDARVLPATLENVSVSEECAGRRTGD